MVTPRRTKLEPATKDKPKTYSFRVRHRGAWLNLDPFTLTAFAAKSDGTQFIPTPSKASPQTDDDEGVFYVTLTAAQLDQVTDPSNLYLLDCYLDDEPLSHRFEFDVEEKQTEA